MSKYVTDEVVEEILERTDLVDIVSEHVRLKKTGKNYMGLCPFHPEKTPSFSVSSEKGLYYCFGCGTGGNAINFIMQTQNYTFKEAVERLAERAGIQLNIENNSKKNIYDEIYKVNELVQKYYNYILWNNRAAGSALSYLKDRGLEEQTIKNFGLGFAQNSWNSILNFLKKRGFEVSFVERAGLVTKNESGNYYDRFRNRLMFPIYNMQGRVVGFGGRKLSDDDKGPKYLNTPETEVFQKSRLLYGMNWSKEEIRKSGKALVAEGYMDVIACHQFGIKNVVASLGTSFTQDQANILKRNCDEVVISFDADVAGNTAALRGLHTLSNSGCKIKVLELPEGYDPDSYLQEKGKEAFLGKVNHESMGLIDYKLHIALNKYNISTPEGKADALRFIINDLASMESAVERQHFLEKITVKLHLPENAVLEELAKTRRLYKYGKSEDKKVNNRNNTKKNLTSEPVNLHPTERIVLRKMLEDREFFLKIKNELGFEVFPDKIKGVLHRFDENLKKENNVNLSNFISMLDEDMASYISRVFTMDEEVDISMDECIKALWLKHLRKQEQDLLTSLSQAEQDGDNDAVNTLIQQLAELQKKIQQRKAH